MRHDVKVVLRGLARAPLTAALAVCALAAATSVTASIFAVTRGVLLRELPYPDGDRLVLVWRGTSHDPQVRGALSPPDYLDVRAQAASFDEVAAINSFSTTYLPEDGPAEQVELGVVAGDFFRVLRADPLVGRLLMPSDDRPLDTRAPGAVGVVVLQHDFWVRAFGGDRAVVGRTIDMGGSRLRVVGVAREQFRLHMPAGAGMSTALVGWTPLGIEYGTAPRDGAYLKVVARLATGATADRAQAELDGIAGRLRSRFPEHGEAGMRLRLAPLHAEVTAHVRPILIVLSTAGLLLLLVASINAATLLLVRFSARRHDVAIRRALGAGTVRLLRPLVLESAFVAIGGTLIGLALAGPAVRLLLRIEPDIVPRTAPLQVDATVAIAALGLSLLLTLGCGLGPAWWSLRGAARLGLGTRADDGAADRRVPRSIIVLQAAAAFVLLYGSASLTRTLVRLQRADFGFTQEVTTARVTLPFARYPTPDGWVRFFDELTRQLASMPGVTTAGFASDLPLDGDLTLEPYVPAHLAGTVEWGTVSALHRIVSAGYFEVIQAPVIAGRTFDDGDRAGAPLALVIDETLARRIADNARDALDHRLVVTMHEFSGGYRVTQRSGDVVGVVATLPHEHPGAAPPGTIYMPHAQYPLWSMVLAARGAGADAPAVGVLRSALRDVDGQLPLSAPRRLTDVVDRTLAPTRFVLSLIGILAAAVVALTAAGLYGVMADAVRQRRHELGIRLAVGATPAGLARRTIREGVLLIAVGMVPGAALLPLATRLLARGVPGVGGLAAFPLAVAAAGLLGIAAAACLIPAWRAGRVDPLRTLRAEP
jgi:putative ABC transport system permease protein